MTRKDIEENDIAGMGNAYVLFDSIDDVKMLKEIYVIEDLIIGQLELFIVKKKNLTKKILKIMKKVIIILKVTMKKIKLMRVRLFGMKIMEQIL